MVARYLLPLALILPLHAEEPWGREVSRSGGHSRAACSPCEWIIRFHQQHLSKTDGPRSHYLPSSSEYMRQAIATWGMAQGLALGLDRLMRENGDQWVYKTTSIYSEPLKYDPVPKPRTDRPESPGRTPTARTP